MCFDEIKEELHKERFKEMLSKALEFSKIVDLSRSRF